MLQRDDEKWNYLFINRTENVLFPMMTRFCMLLDTCAPSGVWPLRVFLVIVGLQDVAVLGHHEDWDEVNNSKCQKLSLLTVLLKQTTYTKWSVRVSSLENSDSWVVMWLFCIFFLLFNSQYLWRQQPWGGWYPCPEEACPNLWWETFHLSLRQLDSACMYGNQIITKLNVHVYSHYGAY